MISEFFAARYDPLLGTHLQEVHHFLEDHEELEGELGILINIANDRGKLEEAFAFLAGCQDVSPAELRDQLIDKQYELLGSKRPRL